MGDWGGAPGMQHLLPAEKLGLAMARRAAEILDRHRHELALATQAPAADATARASDPAQLAANAAQFAADDAIFTAVLDATNDCLGRYDPRPPEDRWCDALVHLLLLARLAPDVD
jgi:hypothetical protein